MISLRAKTTGYKPDGVLPLINIVLLLVLVFMMAGTFTEPLPSDFAPLRSAAAEPQEKTRVPVVLTMNAEGRIALEGREAADELDTFLGSLRLSENNLEVRADARVPAVRVIALLRAAEKSGARDVQIVTLGRR